MVPPPNRARAAQSDPAYDLSPSGKTMLQERLRTYALVTLAVAVSYWPAFFLTWRGHPGVSDALVRAHIFSPWTFVLLALHAALWLLARGRPLAPVALRALDVVYHAAIGGVFAGIIRSHPVPVIAPLEGVLALASVLGARSLIVPSSGARTVLVGGMMALGPGLLLLAYPAHFSAAWMGVRTSGPLSLTWISVAIVLTSVASQVLYGLRREVRDAQRLGQYTLVERLGQGGMGVVYRADHALLRRPTAVKLLPPTKRVDSIVRFEREVQLMAELTHPNTVAIYDYGRTADGVFYYAMEYLDGIDLEGLVALDGPQPPARVIHLLRQACGSLDEAHRHGLIHRDVKPANLFLCRARSEPDTVKVLDFGLAKDVATQAPTLSRANLVIGTPLYMAPEAFREPEAVGARSDLYSLGAVAYLLLTGTPVFGGATAVEICANHLHTEPERPSARLGRELPADLERLVLSCLAKQPEQRPQDALALRAGLDACADARQWNAAQAEHWWRSHAGAVEHRRRSLGRAGSSIGKSVLVDRSRQHVTAPISDTALAFDTDGARLEPS
jgi:eukaryotic-like serine/threonine-protein kinase